MPNQVLLRDKRLNTRFGLFGAAGWLSLAAAPTFAIMTLLAGLPGGGPLDALCSAQESPLTGMVAMYLLMSVFHSAPWLKLLYTGSNRRNHGAN